MTWFKVDDTLAFHHKTIKAGNAAMGLWVRAGSWSSQQLTDGFIPNHMIEVLGTPAQRRRLVSAGLWFEEEDGVFFHDWTENGRQPTREEVLLKRKRDTERKAAFRASSQVKDTCLAGTEEDVREVSHGVSSPPDPTRPDPTLSTTPLPPAEPPSEKPAPTNSKINAAALIAADFEEFWEPWPRKSAKKKALESYRTARKSASAEQLLEASLAHFALWEREARDQTKLPYASTWLNQERWNDVIDKPKFTMITNEDSPWHGYKIDNNPSPWAEWMAR